MREVAGIQHHQIESCLIGTRKPEQKPELTRYRQTEKQQPGSRWKEINRDVQPGKIHGPTCEGRLSRFYRANSTGACGLVGCLGLF